MCNGIGALVHSLKKKKKETERKGSEYSKERIYEGLIQSIKSRKQTKHNKNTAVRGLRRSQWCHAVASPWRAAGAVVLSVVPCVWCGGRVVVGAVW